MTAQQVHQGIEEGGGVVLLQVQVTAHEGGGIQLAQHEVQGHIPQGIVHHAVQGVSHAVVAQFPIGEFVAGVLPHLAQQAGVGIFLFHPLAQHAQKGHGQFVRHVQPPTRAARPQPVGAHRVLVPQHEVQIAFRHLPHVGQGREAPPAIVLVGPTVEGIPPGVGGGDRLVSAQAVVPALDVEVTAVRPGMGKHAVQHHPDAQFFRRPAQGGKIRLVAKAGVYRHVVPGIVLMVGPGPENGVEVEHRHPQLL